MEQQLSSLKNEFYALSSKPPEVIREVVKEYVEVSSESDRLRIRQLEQQVTNLQSDLQFVNQKKQEVVKEYIEVHSETDKLRIR